MTVFRGKSHYRHRFKISYENDVKSGTVYVLVRFPAMIYPLPVEFGPVPIARVLGDDFECLTLFLFHVEIRNCGKKPRKRRGWKRRGEDRKGRKRVEAKNKSHEDYPLAQSGLKLRRRIALVCFTSAE